MSAKISTKSENQQKKAIEGVGGMKKGHPESSGKKRCSGIQGSSLSKGKGQEATGAVIPRKK